MKGSINIATRSPPSWSSPVDTLDKSYKLIDISSEPEIRYCGLAQLKAKHDIRFEWLENTNFSF